MLRSKFLSASGTLIASKYSVKSGPPNSSLHTFGCWSFSPTRTDSAGVYELRPSARQADSLQNSDRFHFRVSQDHAKIQRRDFWNTVLVNDGQQVNISSKPFSERECSGLGMSQGGGKSVPARTSHPHIPIHREDVERLAVRGRKETACYICCALFKRKYDLLQHISAVHDKKRPYKCDTCDSSFAHKGTLSKHVRTVHRRERPYSCEHCGLRFSERGNVNKHKQRAESCRAKEHELRIGEKSRSGHEA